MRFPAFLRSLDEPTGRPLPARTRVVFQHIPKTAGSSFRRILEGLFAPGETCPAEIDDEVRSLSPGERRCYRLYAGHFSHGLLREAFPDALWLTFLRDPVERVVSNHHNLTDPSRHRPQWVRRAAERPAVRDFLDRVASMSLERFVRLGDPRVRDRVVNRQTRCLSEPDHDPWQPDGRDLGDYPLWDEAILERARRNLRERFAFVGIQEEFTLSLRVFAQSFGLRPFGDVRGATDNVNPQRAEGSRYVIPPDVRAYLEEHNRMDAALWRHGRELLFERLRVFGDALLRSDWAQRSVARPELRRPPGPRKLDRRIDRLETLRGFHALEHDGGGRAFRWSGLEDPAGIEFALDAPATATVKVRLTALGAVDDGARTGLSLVLDGERVELALEKQEGRGLVYAGRVPGRVCAGRRHHTLLVAGPLAPEPPPSEYRRRLGIAVHRLEVEVAETGRAPARQPQSSHVS